MVLSEKTIKYFGVGFLIFSIWSFIQIIHQEEIINDLQTNTEEMQSNIDELNDQKYEMETKVTDLENDIEELKNQDTENEEKINTLEGTVENIEDYLRGNRNY